MNRAQYIISLYEETEADWNKVSGKVAGLDKKSDIYKLQLKFRAIKEKLNAIKGLIDKKDQQSKIYKNYQDALLELGNLAFNLIP